MGREIKDFHFSNNDFNRFSENIKQETNQLEQLLKDDAFSNDDYVVGFEIEAVLVSQTGAPIPANHTFLSELDNSLVVHELAAFNVEINSHPLVLRDNALKIMEQKLQSTWDKCRRTAADLSIDIMMIGILPSLQEHHLSLAHMSQLNRYQALNHQIIKMRGGRPLHINIQAKESIQLSQLDVMFESACTSLQLHLQTPIDQSKDFYNASILLSGPMVAATANSPYLFGKELWNETRIPLFEQAVESGNEQYRRVTFGNDYCRESLMECFIENLEHYPVLVPLKEQEKTDQLDCLRFHNGTIWRWNRPLIGFDDVHKPHLRIEHRVIPAGPTIIDTIANAAFYFGLVYEIAEQADYYIETLEFKTVKENFYDCSRSGLSTNIVWPEQNNIPVKSLLLNTLIPMARQGLQKLDISPDDINNYLSIIEQRVDSEQNGADWQHRWIEKNGLDMNRLTQCYLERQNTGEPVHTWTL